MVPWYMLFMYSAFYFNLLITVYMLLKQFVYGGVLILVSLTESLWTDSIW
jgi:hypothetical protein